jgi:hypothetical protein
MVVILYMQLERLSVLYICSRRLLDAGDCSHQNKFRMRGIMMNSSDHEWDFQTKNYQQ